MGIKKHDFQNSPLNSLDLRKRGKVKFDLRFEHCKLKKVLLIRNDFDSTVEVLCRKEIESLEFIHEESYGECEDEYKVIATFKFIDQFRGFTMSPERKTNEDARGRH